jgi:hypothetical protein
VGYRIRNKSSIHYLSTSIWFVVTIIAACLHFWLQRLACVQPSILLLILILSIPRHIYSSILLHWWLARMNVSVQWSSLIQVLWRSHINNATLLRRGVLNKPIRWILFVRTELLRNILIQPCVLWRNRGRHIEYFYGDHCRACLAVHLILTVLKCRSVLGHQTWCILVSIRVNTTQFTIFVRLRWLQNVTPIDSFLLLNLEFSHFLLLLFFRLNFSVIFTVNSFSNRWRIIQRRARGIAQIHGS